MSGSMVSTLQAQRQSYVRQTEEARDEIARYERSYESLSNFKTTVTQSQEEFQSIRTEKMKTLAQLEEVKKNCLTVQRYHSGMQEILSGSVSGGIGAVYAVMQLQIELKLKQYLQKIHSCERHIASYGREIDHIDRQLESAEREARAARPLRGGGTSHAR